MEGVKTLAIPDSLCEELGVTAKLLPGDKIAAFSFNLQDDKKRKVQATEVKLHHLRQNIVLFHPVTRKLINESNGAFLAGQKIAKKESASEVRSRLLKLSRQYRSIIRACLEDLQTEASIVTDEEKDVCLHLVTIFYNIEFLWHLSEILFIDIIPGDAVLPHLLEWVRFHYFHYERQAAAMITTSGRSSPAETQAKYWETLTGLVLQGRTDAARAVLKLHSAANGDAICAADALFQTMPVYSAYGGLSVTEFNMTWKFWQNELKSKIESGIFASKPELELLMQVMAGEPDAFAKIRSQCGTWYQYMVAWLLYTEPTVKTFDLSFHASKCMTAFGQSELREVDLVLLAILECNVNQVVKHISATTENGWFAAHLTNLLFLSSLHPVQGSFQRKIPSNLHEQLLLEYGALLMSHQSLWQVGVSYLDHCKTYGRHYLQLLLSHVPIANESKALLVVQVARNRGLFEIVSSVSRVMVRRWLRLGRWGAALTWALRSQDSKMASYLADQYLQEYCAKGSFSSIDILENLGSSMLLSDRLTFLGKYCEFHQLYRAGDFREAATLLVSIMISKLAPKYFWMTLLIDSLPLLESNDIIFTSSDTYGLSQCLEELLLEKGIVSLSTSRCKKSQKSVNDAEMPDKINLIRVALARNLARALNYEACHIVKKEVPDKDVFLLS
ncbi:nuclear pore complex protein Nup85 isoform X1 [Schistocerca serialis cubense]|uniref:nuclear pore complex protein Nup85 isoform X1 n=1 Tax=Schistocerca serialis cubense TaxID=2023355 RepID=UPI00214F3B61|nr:nuclear pore complex protein Nup85 isoform X1 [Schistocerca serialis cubense]